MIIDYDKLQIIKTKDLAPRDILKFIKETLGGIEEAKLSESIPLKIQAEIEKIQYLLNNYFKGDYGKEVDLHRVNLTEKEFDRLFKPYATKVKTRYAYPSPREYYIKVNGVEYVLTKDYRNKRNG